MPSKSAFISKINWAGILAIVAGAGVLTDQLSPEVGAIVGAAAGIATILLRTFFPTQPIHVTEPK